MIIYFINIALILLCLWLVEYSFTSHQLIYGYIETEDNNDDEVDRNPDLHYILCL